MAEPTPLVAVEDLRFHYSGGVEALRGVSLRLAPGEFVALVGTNGSGKSTLAKHLNGLLRPTAGRVLVAGRDTRTAETGELARTVGYVFQNPDHQIFLPSVEAEVAYGPRNLGIRGEALAARVAEALKRFGLTDLADRHPTLLGRGIRRRVALAAVYAMDPALLVLDEPTGGLDRGATVELMATLAELTAAGRTVLLITHDMRLVAEHAPRMVVLRAGRVLADGPTRAIMGDRALLAEAGLRPAPVPWLAAELAPLGVPPALTVEELAAAVEARVAAPVAGRTGVQGSEGRER